MSPFAIATQGIGFGARLTAVQGLYTFTTTPEPPSPAPPYSPPSGGGGWAAPRPKSPKVAAAIEAIKSAPDWGPQNQVIIQTVVIAVTSGILE